MPSPGVAISQVVPLTYYAGGHPTSRLDDDAHAGFTVNVTVDLFAIAAVPAVSVSVVGSWPGATAVTQSNVALTAGGNSVVISIPASQTKAVRLWHPHGHGGQPMYNITTTLQTPSTRATPATPPTARPSTTAAAPPSPAAAPPSPPPPAAAAAAVVIRRVGFRHVALVTFNDTDPVAVKAAQSQEGSGSLTMMFRVNGAAVYARGGSMVPMDLLNGRLSAGAHRRVVQSAAEGNMNILRIWGGAVYMPPAFYEACDDFGVMLYHDMQFTGKAGASGRKSPSATENLLEDTDAVALCFC